MLETLPDEIRKEYEKYVLRGEEIGYIGASAAAEVLDGAHLHFEVFLNDFIHNLFIFLTYSCHNINIL